MRLQPLGTRERDRVRRELLEGFARGFDGRAASREGGNVHARCEARRSCRRQHVVAARHIVSQCRRRVGAHKDATRTFDRSRKRTRVSCHHLRMFRGKQFDERGRVACQVFDEQTQAVLLPAFARNGTIGQPTELPFDLFPCCLDKPLVVADQHGASLRVMLGLREQVGCQPCRRGAVVGKDQNLGRTGERIDADASEQLAFRFRDPRVARSCDQIDAGNALAAQRKRSDGLRTAKAIDLVDGKQAQRFGKQRRKRRCRRRGGDDKASHAGEAGGSACHQQRAGIGMATAGDIERNRFDGRNSRFQPHARRLAHVVAGVGLALVKIPYPRVRYMQGSAFFGRNARRCVSDRLRLHAQRIGVLQSVPSSSEVAQRALPLAFDARDHLGGLFD